jgi:hypothetical protein
MPLPVAKPSTVIYDFPGLSDIPRSAVNQVPGTAEEQINTCSVIEGELLVRRGIREVAFEDI